MDNTTSDLQDLKTSVHKILELLRGNEIDKDDKGFVGMVNDHEERIIKLEKIIDRGKYIMIGMAIPSGFGVTSIISYLIEHYK